MALELELLVGEFAVCRLGDAASPTGALCAAAQLLQRAHREANDAATFVSLSVTGSELSLVCPTDWAPTQGTLVEPGWRALRVCGQLDFGMVGVLAGLAGVLAAANVSIFAVSTYDTDYILFRTEMCGQALAALAEAGYKVERLLALTNKG